MEIVKRKIDIVFDKEEIQAIEKVIDILAEIEWQNAETVEQIEKQFEEYRYPSTSKSPTVIAIDYLASLIKFGEED